MADVSDLVDLPAVGRTYSDRRSVRLGDVGPRGRLRLDAAARYLQDVSNDDAIDADLEGAMAWVVRRTRIDVEQAPVFREVLTSTTWCSGIGARWASRRVEVVGERGGLLRCEALWVHLDLERGTPKRLPDDFVALFGEAAGGTTIRARLEHDAAVSPHASSRPWATRFADFDLLGHVNNAVSWAMVEEVLSDRPELRQPMSATVEHPGPIDPGEQVILHVADAAGTADGFDLWATADDRTATTARVRSSPRPRG
ncbi:MAG TPA: acyl-ACP thioesterase domain-containing protein [Acidimicrobiales bacterium]|nr:acyl-ACP thioesterase domain-containing protein [Acidimicrobiales bacterium]